MIRFLLLLLLLQNVISTTSGGGTIRYQNPAATTPTRSTTDKARTLQRSSPTPTLLDLSNNFEDAPHLNKNTGAESMASFASAEPKGILSYVVLQHGQKVAEYTRDENTTVNSLNPIFSASKSWTGLVVGVMIDNGQLCLNDTLLDIWPDETGAFWQNVTDAAVLKNTTVEALLTMTSGFIDSLKMYLYFGTSSFTGTTLLETLELMDFQGEAAVGKFNYLAAGNIMGYIVQERSGLTLEGFANKFIMSHLGIQPGEHFWTSNVEGVSHAYFGLYMTVLQLSKLGQLYLQNGMASNTTRVVSESWVTESTKGQVETDYMSSDYGYLWYRYDELEAYCAQGLGGQYCCVWPEKDMVMSVMADTSNALIGVTYEELSYALVVLVSGASFDTITIDNESIDNGAAINNVSFENSMDSNQSIDNTTATNGTLDTLTLDETSGAVSGYMINSIVVMVTLMACSWF